MKKKIVLFGMACFCLIYVILIVWSCIFQIYLLLGFLLLICFVGCISVYGLILYRRFMADRMIDPKNNLKRNYKRILLGSFNKEEKSDDALDLRGYRRNFYVDSLLVQRYYSFLAPDGKIIIKTQKSNKYRDSTKICVLDYPLMHPVTLLEHGVKPPKYILYNPFVGLLFLSVMISSKICVKKTTIEVEDKELMDFCKQRGIHIIIES